MLTQLMGIYWMLGEAVDVFSMHLRILGCCLMVAHGLSFKSLHVHT